MTVTVEMTDEEFTEFLKFQKTKQAQNEKLSSALRSVRADMEKLANTLLRAVDFDSEREEKPSVKNEELFYEAVQIANDWFC